MAARWIASLRFGATPAVAIAASTVASCVLPAYVVGDATSSASTAATGTGRGAGGAGGSGGTSATSAGGSSPTGPGAGGDGGSGIGGHVSCNATSGGKLVAAMQDRPHGVTTTKSHVFWISGDDTVWFVPRTSPAPPPTPIPGVTRACGIDGATHDGVEQLVIRRDDGQILVAKTPFTGVTMAFPARGGPLVTKGSCAIAQGASPDAVWGFEHGGSGLQLVAYDLSNKSSNITAMQAGLPVGLDAKNDEDVAWLDGTPGTGTLNVVTKTTAAKVNVGLPPGSYEGLCTIGQTGTFVVTEPGENAIASWSKVDGPDVFVTGTLGPREIACARKHQAWIQADRNGPASCFEIVSATGPGTNPQTVADGQAQACSIAIDGKAIFWTNCEPDGSVFTARAK